MRKLLIPVLLILAAATLWLLGHAHGQRYTTSSPRARALLQQAREELYVLNTEVADSLLQEALRLDPDFAAAHALRSLVLHRAGRRATAAAESSRAVALLPRLKNGLERDRIRLLLEYSGGHEAVVDSLVDRILARDPRDVMALNIKAMLLFPDDPGAAEALRRVLAVDPNNALAYNLLGYLDARRGDYASAVDHLKTYVFLAPDRANPHDSLGEILGWIGQYDEAERELREALRLQPGFTPARLHLGEVLMDRGEVRRGTALLRRLRQEAAKGGSGVASAVDRVVLTGLYGFELYDRAAAWTDTFLAGSHPRNLYFQAVAAATRGDSLRARAIMEGLARRLGGQGERGARTTAVMTAQLDAILAEVHGDVAAARRAWRRTLTLLPDAAPHETWSIRWRLGRLALAAGEPRRALALADSVLAINPNRLQALELDARVLAALADTAAARAVLERLAPLAARADADLPVIRRYRDLRQALLPETAEPPAGGREAP